MKWIFTFGSGHYDANHDSLGNFYTVIEADSESEARDLMHEKRDIKWSFSYPWEKKATAVDRFNLTLIPFTELTAQSGLTR
jgi:hypothetical protein